MEPLRDQRVEEQFHKLVKNFITKNPNYEMSKFIGGMPVTLEKTDLSNLMLKGRDNKSKYTVTQKVDGTRYLMYIGPDTGVADIKQRKVCFVDRNMKLYTIQGLKLPDVNTPEMLLDGELVFFDRKGESFRELDPVNIKGVSFMVFDILFGPENISIDSDGNKVIGQSFSMTVPEDGKLRTTPWPYISRYDILSKMIIPNKSFNKNEPILPNAFKLSDRFNIELKPIYFLNTLLTANLPLYNSSGSGWLQNLLKEERKNYYNYIAQIKPNSDIFRGKLKLDGLIFTASDTLYTIGNWNNILTAQYKWKPIDEQTIDLKIKKLTNTTANVLMKKGKNLEFFQDRGKNAIVFIPQNINDNTINEFGFDNGRLIFKNSRSDKTEPNAIRTITNVLRSFKNPVNIDNLIHFLKPDNKTAYKVILEHSSKTKLFKCISMLDTFQILKDDDIERINDMIKNVNTSKEIEVEMRLGKIVTGKNVYFNPLIDRSYFENILIRVSNFGFKKNIEDFIDIYSDGIRTRYLYSSDFGKYIQYESIIKNRLYNVDIDISNVLNFDTRFSLSNETRVSEYNTKGDTKRKYRISFLEPNNLFRLDFTAITNVLYIPEDRIYKNVDVPDEKFQIEIEFLSDKIVVPELFKFLTNVLSI